MAPWPCWAASKLSVGPKAGHPPSLVCGCGVAVAPRDRVPNEHGRLCVGVPCGWTDSQPQGRAADPLGPGTKRAPTRRVGRAWPVPALRGPGQASALPRLRGQAAGLPRVAALKTQGSRTAERRRSSLRAAPQARGRTQPGRAWLVPSEDTGLGCPAGSMPDGGLASPRVKALAASAPHLCPQARAPRPLASPPPPRQPGTDSCPPRLGPSRGRTQGTIPRTCTAATRALAAEDAATPRGFLPLARAGGSRPAPHVGRQPSTLLLSPRSLHGGWNPGGRRSPREPPGPCRAAGAASACAGSGAPTGWDPQRRFLVVQEPGPSVACSSFRKPSRSFIF